MEGGEEFSGVKEPGVSRTSVVGTPMATTASSTAAATSGSSNVGDGGPAAAVAGGSVADGTGGGSAAQPGSGDHVAAASQPTTAKVRQSRTTAAAQHKCSIRGCKLGRNPVPVDICSASDCDRRVHGHCYEHLIVRKFSLPPTDPDGESANLCFCTLACYKKFMKANEGGTNWHNDGKNGADDPNCSENLLVRLFLSDQQAYARFRDPYPETKNDVCQEWADTLNAHGVKNPRTAKHVQNKIATIESQMREAVDFAFTKTGKGLQEEDPDKFERAIQLKCKFWNELSAVFMERAGIKPLLTTQDIFGDGSPNDSSDERSNFSVGSQQQYNDDSDDDSDSSQHKKGRGVGVLDLSNSTDDDDDDDEEEEEHSKNDNNDGGGRASSSHQQQPVRKRHTNTKKAEGKAKKSKTEKRDPKKPSKKPPSKISPKKANTDDLLQKLLVMKTEEMQQKKRMREQREKQEEEKKKRKKFEDYDLDDFDQWFELSEKFKRICDTVGGSRVQAALQFPQFAETNLLSAEEKQEFRRQQLQQQQQF